MSCSNWRLLPAQKKKKKKKRERHHLLQPQRERQLCHRQQRE
jgi:hypothetical protein